MDKKKICDHKSFQLSGTLWKCQWCPKEFTEEEIKQIMFERRQGFGESRKSVTIIDS